jgi:hypothetical protein
MILYSNKKFYRENMKNIAIGNLEYYKINSKEEFNTIVKIEKINWDDPDMIFSDAIKGREKINGEYIMPGIYEVFHFCYNPCDYGFYVRFIEQDYLEKMMSNLHDFLYSK